MHAPIPFALSRRHALVGVSAAAAAFLCGCNRRDAGTEPKTPALRIATPLVPHAGLVHIASARGLFRDQGLEAILVPQTHGKAALADLLRGKADLAIAADVPVVVEVLKGAPLSIVASLASASNELAVLGRVDRGIRSPGDLIGRKVGVTLGTSGEYFLWAFLTRSRIAPQSLQLVDLPPSRLIESLRNGMVDAVAAWQPVRHEAEVSFGKDIVSLHAPDAYAQRFVLVGQRDYVRAQQPALRRLLLALTQAEAFARAEGWWRSAGRLDVAAAYRDRAIPGRLSEGRLRRSYELLAASRGRHDVASMQRILRDHLDGGAAWQPGASIEEERFFTLCAHSEPLHWTTASLVAPLPADRSGPWPVWISFGTPCTGIFLPVYLDGLLPHALARGSEAPDPESAWWSFKRLQDAASADPQRHTPVLRRGWEPLESEIEAERENVERRARQSARMGDRDRAAELVSDFMARSVEAALALANTLRARIS